MTRILRIDASSRHSVPDGSPGEGSFSRALADAVLAELCVHESDVDVVVRDLAADPLPHVHDTTIRAYYTSADAMTSESRRATALSDTLIAELESADVLVLSIPIYNFAMPSAFKAWIDQVVRIGRTFSYVDGRFAGLVSGKRAYVCNAYGASGYLDGGPLAGHDHLSPYVNLILGFIGIGDVTTFAIEATTGDPDTIARVRETALANVARHFGPGDRARGSAA